MTRLIGQTFGRLTVVAEDPTKKRYVICKCTCGNTTSVFSGNLTRGLTRSCGCLNRELSSQRLLNDLTGRKFGRLTVLRRADTNAKNRNPKWVVQCSCPARTVFETTGWNLTHRSMESCGCIARELAEERRKRREMLQQQKERVREQREWERQQAHITRTSVTKYTEEEQQLVRIVNYMIQRCYNPDTKSYPLYGGRGIQVCNEWYYDRRAFANWAKSHGWKPGLTIDRIDNNGPYSPENCRFVGMVEQSNNRRSNVLLTVSGITHTLAEWARLINITYRIFWHMTPYERVAAIQQYLSSCPKA